MKRIAWIGVVVTVLIGAGITVAWIGQSDGQLVVQSPVAIAQTSSGSETVNQAITDSGQSAIKAAIAAVGPAVVRIDVTGSSQVSDSANDLFNDPFFEWFFNTPDEQPRERLRESLGSGFAISYEGEKLIITNQHVIANADTIEVTANDGTVWSASLVGGDDVLDVAVLRLNGNTDSLPTVELGDSEAVEIGDWAIAIGSPLGLSYTVTMGIISAIDRDIEKPSGIGNFNNLFQTDAAINPGNSGGPLVNALGQVIGINTMIARSTSGGVAVEGINFAIAINGITEVLPQLIQSGEIQRGWLGVQHTNITAEAAEAFEIDPTQPGTLVVFVFPGDPADLAGIRRGDVILQVGNAVIETGEDLNREVGLLPAGSVVDFLILRDGETLTLTVTLGLRPSEQELLSYDGSAPQSSDTNLGIEVGAITSSIAEHLGLNSTNGVVIMDVESGSRGQQAGLLEGDVILEIDSVAIATVDEWDSVVSQGVLESEVTLTVIRKGTIQFITVE